MSDGQKARLIYAVVTLSRPNVLLLDEPTNHLDVGAIDSLAKVIKEFTGGVVLVSHDFRLIDQVADVIWECTGPQEGATATAIGNTEDPTSARGTAEEPSFLRPASLTIMTAAAPSLT